MRFNGEPFNVGELAWLDELYDFETVCDRGCGEVGVTLGCGGAVGNCGGGAWLVGFFDGGTFCSIVFGGGSVTGCDGVAGNA